MEEYKQDETSATADTGGQVEPSDNSNPNSNAEQGTGDLTAKAGTPGPELLSKEELHGGLVAPFPNPNPTPEVRTDIPGTLDVSASGSLAGFGQTQSFDEIHPEEAEEDNEETAKQALAHIDEGLSHLKTSSNATFKGTIVHAAIEKIEEGAKKFRKLMGLPE
jgi:hypothetical protein